MAFGGASTGGMDLDLDGGGLKPLCLVMTGTTEKQNTKTEASTRLVRREREAAALRANLAKRKAQSRARRDAIARKSEQTECEGLTCR